MLHFTKNCVPLFGIHDTHCFKLTNAHSAGEYANQLHQPQIGWQTRCRYTWSALHV